MSITIRKTGNKEYAYMAHRDGAHMVQSYIGRLPGPRYGGESTRRNGLRRCPCIPCGYLPVWIPVPSPCRGTSLPSSLVCWNKVIWRTCRGWSTSTP